jgi:chromosome segregation ATPase
MSKKFIAKVDNITFKGKRYSLNDEVLVDNSEKMNPFRWVEFNEFQEQQEKIARDTTDITIDEAKLKIKNLQLQLENSGNDESFKILEAELEERDKNIADLELEIKSSETLKIKLENQLKKAIEEIEYLKAESKKSDKKSDKNQNPLNTTNNKNNTEQVDK